MKKIFNYLIENSPVYITFIVAILLFCTSLFDKKILSLETNSNFITITLTLITVINALLITSLTVFGSAKSYSILYMTKSKQLTKKFILYIRVILFSSILVFILAIFFNYCIKLYLLSIVFILTNYIAYTHICIVMFEKNMENFNIEEKNEKNESDYFKIQLKNIEKNINKVIDVLNEIKNK